MPWLPRVVALLAMSPLTFAADQPVGVATVAELKSHPLSFDDKVVQVEGWLTSGHVGVFLYDDAKHDSIRVRSPDELKSISSKQIKRDKLFEALWKLSEHEISLASEHNVHVEFRANVRVLKVHGKPAKDFSVLG